MHDRRNRDGIADRFPWELEDAVTAGRTVWIYRKTTPPQIAINAPDWVERVAQYQSVERFARTARAPDGSLRFGIHTFEHDDELRRLVGQHVRQLISILSQQVAEGSPPAARSGGSPPSPPPSLAEDVVAVVVGEHLAGTVGDGPSASTHSPVALKPLGAYPLGPMLKDVEAKRLAEAIAEIRFGEDVRNTFAGINKSLAAVRSTDDPELRLAVVMFSTSSGTKHFWDDVLHRAAIEGPRVLAAVLSTVDARQLEGSALTEFQALVRRVNHHV
jgi:hypothetical protein